MTVFSLFDANFYLPSLYSCFGLSCFCVDPDFEFDDDDVKTKEIVNKILQLPLGDRLWPNCLGRVVRNSSPVNVEEYASRLNLEVEVEDGDDDQSKSVPVKTIAQRTRSKAIAAAVKTSGSVQSLSSSSFCLPCYVRCSYLASLDHHRHDSGLHHCHCR